MIKQTKLRQRFSLQADAFNVLNHPSFEAPTTSSSLYSVNSSGVPTVRTFSTSFGYVQRTIGSPRFLQVEPEPFVLTGRRQRGQDSPLFPSHQSFDFATPSMPRIPAPS